MTPWTPADIPDQTGRVALVTGANGGLGLAVTRELARKGALVVMAGRDRGKVGAARAGLLAELPGASLALVTMDLASLASVEQAARATLERHPVLDLLINNAGVMATPEARTEDGFELQFGTNHLGPFALTAHMAKALARAEAARVVAVTSTGRHIGRSVDPRNPHLEGKYDPWRAYGQSKLANVHFALELNRRLEAAGAPARSLVAHPGLSDTNLQARSVAATDGGLSQRFFHTLARRTGMSPARGAHSILRAATDPDARGGDLYAPRWVNHGPAVRRPLFGRSTAREPAARLWRISERETGVRFDVEAAVAGAA